MDRTITLDCNGNDITCMKVFDALKYPCSACDIKDCPDRETYQDEKFNLDGCLIGHNDIISNVLGTEDGV